MYIHTVYFLLNLPVNHKIILINRIHKIFRFKQLPLLTISFNLVLMEYAYIKFVLLFEHVERHNKKKKNEGELLRLNWLLLKWLFEKCDDTFPVFNKMRYLTLWRTKARVDIAVFYVDGIGIKSEKCRVDAGRLYNRLFSKISPSSKCLDRSLE
jgi:hypothetical protein